MKIMVVRHQRWDLDLFGFGVVVIKLNVVELEDEARSTRMKSEDWLHTTVFVGTSKMSNFNQMYFVWRIFTKKVQAKVSDKPILLSWNNYKPSRQIALSLFQNNRVRSTEETE